MQKVKEFEELEVTFKIWDYTHQLVRNGHNECRQCHTGSLDSHTPVYTQSLHDNGKDYQPLVLLLRNWICALDHLPISQLDEFTQHLCLLVLPIPPAPSLFSALPWSYTSLPLNPIHPQKDDHMHSLQHKWLAILQKVTYYWHTTSHINALVQLRCDI